MPFADSHVHLADPAFADDAEAVIVRAREAGAAALVCIGESPAAAVRARGLVARFPGLVFHTCGVHPHDAFTWEDERDARAIRQEMAAGAVAVGECGLDYHYDHSPRERQRAALQAQLALAAELDRPLVLHTRLAEDDTRAFLLDAAHVGVTGVLHCFTGSVALASAGLDAGWYVSFSGIITFRSWTDEALLQRVPADRLLIESDAPYLAPVPHRGKRNESGFVPLTAQRLATARGVSADELMSQTLENTRQLFRLPSGAAATH
jgi:TatD DNase family protein